FGENKGSYCIVAKLGDGRKENFVDSINIDELEQRSIEHRSKTAFENSSRMKMKSLSHLAQHQQAQRHLASMAANNHLAVAAHLAGSAGLSSAKQQNRQQSPATSLINQFISTTSANLGAVNNSVASYHAMNGTGNANVPNGALTSAGSTPNSHHGIGGSPVGNAASLTNGFSGVDHHAAYASALGASVNGLNPVFGSGPGSGSASAGLFPATGAAGSQTTNQPPTGAPFQPYQSAAQYFFHQQQQHVNFQQQQMAAAAAIQHQGPWSTASGLFSANSANKFLTGMACGGAGSPQQQAHPASSSTPPTTSVIGQSRAASLGGVVSSLTSGGFGTNRVQTSSSAATTPTNAAVKSNSQTNSNAAALLTNGGLMGGNNGANSNQAGSNSMTGNGANPNAPVFVPRTNYLYSQFNLSAQPFTPSSLTNSKND
ncbi:hypothetical protein BLA29_004672, partial [Euroglyphus maynei]